jgi:uncharacterized protein YdeI (YjbR/CyaY-like superfamily)
VHGWYDVFQALRELVLESGLVEEVKWKVPTYTLNGKNVLIIAAFKEYCGLNMFKGVLINDPSGILEFAGPNSREAMVGRFRSVEQVQENAEAIREILRQAVELERSGAVVPKRDAPDLDLPEELVVAMDADPSLASAFFALTPGRQRSHVIHISGAKQSKTRESRVEKCVPKILAGQGFLDWAGKPNAAE